MFSESLFPRKLGVGVEGLCCDDIVFFVSPNRANNSSKQYFFNKVDQNATAPT